MGLIKYNGVNYSGGGSSGEGITSISQADYDALPAEEKNKGAYYIFDADRGTTVVELEEKLTTSDGTEIFNYDKVDGKPGFWTKEADTDVFIPFSKNLEIEPIEVDQYLPEAYIAEGGVEKRNHHGLIDFPDFTGCKNTEYALVPKGTYTVECYIQSSNTQPHYICLEVNGEIAISQYGYDGYKRGFTYDVIVDNEPKKIGITTYIDGTSYSYANIWIKITYTP